MTLPYLKITLNCICQQDKVVDPPIVLAGGE